MRENLLCATKTLRSMIKHIIIGILAAMSILTLSFLAGGATFWICDYIYALGFSKEVTIIIVGSLLATVIGTVGGITSYKRKF